MNYISVESVHWLRLSVTRSRDRSLVDVATPTLVPVEVVEVGDDDRNRQCNGEHAGDDAQRPDQLSPHADRMYVTVPVTPSDRPLYSSPTFMPCLQCFDAVGWAAERAYGL